MSSVNKTFGFCGDFDSLQREIFKNIFQDCHTPDSAEPGKAENCLKKKGKVLAITPASRKIRKLNSKAAKELVFSPFSPAFKEKKKYLEEVIDKIKGNPAEQEEVKQLIKVQDMKNLMKTELYKPDIIGNPTAAKPRGRPRKISQKKFVKIEKENFHEL